MLDDAPLEDNVFRPAAVGAVGEGLLGHGVGGLEEGWVTGPSGSFSTAQHGACLLPPLLSPGRRGRLGSLQAGRDQPLRTRSSQNASAAEK